MSDGKKGGDLGNFQKSEVLDLLEEMRGPFLDASNQKLERLNELIDALWADRTQSPKYLTEFIGIVHSLKGGGGSFGYPQITMICHHFETYLEDVATPTDDHLADFQAFLDKLTEGIEIWPAPSDDTIDQMVKALPRNQLPEAEVGNTDTEISVLLVTQTKSISQLVRFFLTDFGCDVQETADPFEAFKTAIQMKPRLLISSVVLDGMSGIDLVAALQATQTMADCRFALLSSTTDFEAISKDASNDVSVISTNDIEEILEQFELE